MSTVLTFPTAEKEGLCIFDVTGGNCKPSLGMITSWGKLKMEMGRWQYTC